MSSFLSLDQRQEQMLQHRLGLAPKAAAHGVAGAGGHANGRLAGGGGDGVIRGRGGLRAGGQHTRRDGIAGGGRGARDGGRAKGQQHDNDQEQKQQAFHGRRAPSACLRCSRSSSPPI